MNAVAVHPFITGKKIHSIKFEKAEKIRTESREIVPVENLFIEAVEEGFDVTEEFETTLTSKPGKKKFAVPIMVGLMCVSVTGLSAMMFGKSIIADNVIPEDGAITKVSLEDAGPKIINNEIPADYPGVYPGEQKVVYHLAPLPNDQLVEEEDQKGCRWLRVVGKTSGIMAYPRLGQDGQQMCRNPGDGVVPLQARMVRDMLPQVTGSTLKIIDVIDSRSGKTVIARNVPPLESLIGMGGPDIEMGSIGSLPSQAQPSRMAAVSTASDMPQATARSTPQRSITQESPRQAYERNTQPVGRGWGQPSGRSDPNGRAPLYVPPEGDEMVSISGSGGLNPIKPGDQPGPSRPRNNDAPSGSPMEGYAPISGND